MRAIRIGTRAETRGSFCPRMIASASSLRMDASKSPNCPRGTRSRAPRPSATRWDLDRLDASTEPSQDSGVDDVTTALHFWVRRDVDTTVGHQPESCECRPVDQASKAGGSQVGW